MFHKKSVTIPTKYEINIYIYIFLNKFYLFRFARMRTELSSPLVLRLLLCFLLPAILATNATEMGNVDECIAWLKYVLDYSV